MWLHKKKIVLEHPVSEYSVLLHFEFQELSLEAPGLETPGLEVPGLEAPGLEVPGF